MTDESLILVKTGATEFAEKLKLGKIRGSSERVRETLKILEQAVLNLEWKTAKDIINILTILGDHFSKADPSDNVPRNMVLRVLKEIRNEYETHFLTNPKENRERRLDETEESMHQMMVADQKNFDYDEVIEGLRDLIFEYINELRFELDEYLESIATKSVEYFSSYQQILSVGKSRSVEAFLKNAAKKNAFHVFMVECAPLCNGHAQAEALTKAGINVTIIPDSAMFAIMSRINKVVIGTYSVMADGGLKAVSGSYTLALAAKHFSVPLIVCTPIFKITPQYLVSHDQVAFNKFNSPHEVFPFKEGRFATRSEIVNPAFDYVPPELINGYVTNWGCNTPSYVYRLLSELYHRKDYL